MKLRRSEVRVDVAVPAVVATLPHVENAFEAQLGGSVGSVESPVDAPVLEALLNSDAHRLVLSGELEAPVDVEVADTEGIDVAAQVPGMKRSPSLVPEAHSDRRGVPHLVEDLEQPGFRDVSFERRCPFGGEPAGGGDLRLAQLLLEPSERAHRLLVPGFRAQAQPQVCANGVRGDPATIAVAKAEPQRRLRVSLLRCPAEPAHGLSVARGRAGALGEPHGELPLRVDMPPSAAFRSHSRA